MSENYTHLEEDAHDATLISFLVGRNNQDKNITRINPDNDEETIYPPDYDDTSDLALLPPDGLVSRYEVQGVVLNWNNTEHSLFDYVRIIRNENNTPANPDDGVIVYEGSAETFVDVNVSAMNTYYYAAYSVNTAGEYSAAGNFTSIDTRQLSVYGTVTAYNAPIAGVSLTLKNTTSGAILDTSLTGRNSGFTYLYYHLNAAD